ncbi:hypothetical protein [Halorubrum distributum]|uniref:Group 1 glycosyl transferase n=1 Tax=Halorubrum distributum JCM 10247 TaxID=1227486 RepID=M0DKI9_9EURY|nr:hypothetical protein [Halorubrum terrestre]ELZ35991.1 group 1 glycosyl transferase [Halorubrum terrestre JCM 10247]
MDVLWLRPHTGDNVSVRRERISEHLAEMDVDVTLVDATGTSALSAAYEAITGDYDVIVGTVRMGLYVGYPLSVALRKPFVGDVTDPLSQIEDLPRTLFSMLERYEWFVLRRSDKSVFVYESSYQEAIDRGVSDPVRLPNAVDYSRFAEPAEWAVNESRAILEEHGIGPDSRIAIYTGSMVERYHLAEIGEASERLPDWEFVFIGKDRGADINSIVSNRSNAHFLGSFDYDLVPGFLAHADIGLCLIDAEQPLKLKEFTAAGLSTLVIPAMKQWYDYDNLIFTEPEPEAIVSAISDDRKNSITDYPTKTSENELESWNDISRSYLCLFETVLR